jgi:hypothetical protein
MQPHPIRLVFKSLEHCSTRENAVNQSDSDFLKYIKTKCGMPDAKELERLRGILEKMRLQSIFSWVEPEKAKSE